MSNAYPPTVCFLLGGIWTIGAVMLLRPYLQRWLQRRRPWKATIAVNAVIMTLFLWHMTAFLCAVLVLWPLGLAASTKARRPGGCSGRSSSASRGCSCCC